MKKKILFVIPALRGGGVERVLVVLLRHFDRSLFEPVLIVFETLDEFPGELPEDVRIVALDAVDKRGAIGNIRLIMALARNIKREAPDIICSFMEYTNHLTSLAKRIACSHAPLYLTYHSDMSQYYRPGRLRSARLIKWILRHIIYPKATKVVCVSKGVMDDLVNNWRLPRTKAIVIHNPIEIDRIKNMVLESVDHPWFRQDIPIIVACGRLAQEKNYPLLLRAFAMVNKEKTVCRLAILGQGPLKDELQSYAETLGVADSVEFMGFQKNPFKYIACSKFLVLSSDWEGFPMVIIEAMSCGTPVISTRCPSGPDESITDGLNGLLVPVDDDDALAHAMIRLLKDELLRQRLIAGGRVRAEDFNVQKIVKAYEALFLEIA